ncbi:trans-sialidase, putative, partial [Trypanosoma cruzi marinkellei]
ENQLYHFANYNFTLVATVSMHNVPKSGSIPLMGVRLDGENSKLMELSYNSENNKWNLLHGVEDAEEHSRTLATGRSQHVVILIRNGTQGSAYVDGQSVGNAPFQLTNANSKEISHFYIGGDAGEAGNGEDVSVTVKNVLLYNRPLDGNEIAALKPNKASISPQMNRNIQEKAIQSSGGQPGQKEQPLGKSRADIHSVSTSAASTVVLPQQEWSPRSSWCQEH